MSRRDDHMDPLSFFFGGLLGTPRPEPTTNAGRYLRQLENGDRCFRRADEAIEDELACALRRIQLTSAREVRPC